jgi:hypothetical protein
MKNPQSTNMKRTVVLLFSLATLLVAQSLGEKKNLVSAKVKIVENLGAEGAAKGTGHHTITQNLTAKAIINNEHVLLECYEHHKQCMWLGTETEYDAEIKSGKEKQPDIWIFFVRPIDHATFRQHWKVVGSW